MTPALSVNTQAILLLTAPLISGRDRAPAELLTPGEYKRLAMHLRGIKQQPSDLISPIASDVLYSCDSVIEVGRLQSLLSRGFLLSQVIERWQSRAIWVVSRADAAYPRRLKARLREDAPAVLYGCGEMGLLEAGGLAVVGSRRAEGSLIDYAAGIGRLAASAGKVLVSGGAKGIDQAAMQGALDGGGWACGVLSDSLEKAVMNRENRNNLLDGRLVLVSPYDPSSSFNVGHAMQRNKSIYALAEVSLVVSSDLKKGGTWAGASEQLEKIRSVPVFVRSTGARSEGLEGIRTKGALLWPNPRTAEELLDVLKMAVAKPDRCEVNHGQLFSEAGPVSSDAITNELSPKLSLSTESAQPGSSGFTGPEPSERLFEKECEVLSSEASPAVGRDTDKVDSHQGKETNAEALFSSVRAIVTSLLDVPMTEVQIAKELDVSGAQSKVWVRRLVDEGVVQKLKDRGMYVAKSSRPAN